MTTTQPTPTSRMSALDAEFFFVEHDNVPMHLGSLAVFDGPAPAHLDLVRLFEAKLDRVPRYRQVVRTTPWQIFRPVWADDAHFDIANHVRYATVPAPGDPEQLRVLAARLFTQRMDLGRPLWEEWFLDGLGDGRWAILSKVHHAMVDGIGGNDLMALVFDTDPDAPSPAAASWEPARGPSLAELAADSARDVLAWPLRQLTAAPGRLRRLAKPADLVSFSAGLGESVQRLSEPSASFLNGPIGPRRRWAWTTASLTEMKQIRAVHGGTINDVVLAAVTCGFRDLLNARHELTDGLVVRTLVPVSVRSSDEAGVIANRVAAVLANLPAGEPDPLRRLTIIRQEMDSIKRTHQAAGAGMITGMLGFAAPMWLALGSRAAFALRQPLVQTVTTNVPGPRSPLYVLGRGLTALYPYVPIGNSVRISVAILSYLDHITFGVTADYESVPDLDVLVQGIRRGLDELSEQPASAAPA